jgi:hypothetical protein
MTEYIRKNIAIFFDCHGLEIINYINMNSKLHNYNARYISINGYVKDKTITKLNEKDIQCISDADILILQVIEKDRGYLNNEEIIKYCKENCIILKIPHYRNSVYEYRTIEEKYNKYDLIKNWQLPKKIKDLGDIEGTINIINNEINIMNNLVRDKDEMQKSLISKVNQFFQIDNLSDVKMLDYYKENYKKYRLFQGRSYPSSIFFYELTNRIMDKLNIPHNSPFVDNYFADNTGEPIPNYWHIFCNFTFENLFYTCEHIYITEYEWYYILLLSNNPNITHKAENMKFINKIRNK